MKQREPSVPRSNAMTKRILLIDADGDCHPILTQAADELEADVMLARTSRQAFTLLRGSMHMVNLVVIDVDPGAHGLALLEAISACAEAPPAVVISALEESYMHPIALEHGATACLGKPVTLAKLRGAIRIVSKRCPTCDRWGSLIPARTDEAGDLRRSFRGIAEKLSPMISRGGCAAHEENNISPAI
jgi:DNA-binding response OmpR family regulator